MSQRRSILLTPPVWGALDQHLGKRTTRREWSVLLDQKGGGKSLLKEVASDLSLDWQEEFIMINSLVGSLPPLVCELLRGINSLLFIVLSLVPGMVLGTQQVFSKYLVNKWTSPAENSKSKNTEMCEHAQCRRKGRWHTVKGAVGRQVSATLIPVQSH